MSHRRTSWPACCSSLVAAGLLVGSNPVQSADVAGMTRVQTSLFTKHYSPSIGHNNNQRLLNLEVTLDDRQVEKLPLPTTDDVTSRLNDISWSAGLATFNNSFGQRSVYAYLGGRYRVMMTGSELNTYVKLTAGFIHGYRGESSDKIPLNQLGIAPAILPAMGIEFRRTHVELVFFGDAGIMLTTGFAF